MERADRDVVDCVEELGERLEAVHDIAVKNGLVENSKRKQYYGLARLNDDICIEAGFGTIPRGDGR